MNIVKKATAGFFIGALVLASTMTPAFAQTQDSVIGQGTASGSTFNVNAVSGPNGENPSGTVDINTQIGHLFGDVTCVHVVGNTATVGGVDNSSSTGTFTSGAGFVLHVQDNSPTTADLLRLEQLSTQPPACPEPNLISPTAVTTGDITVTDATAEVQNIGTLRTSVQNLNLDNGTENSLVSKLDAAEKGKAPDNCNQLNAFINEVNAQTGKNITSNQASDLVQQANQVRANLGCQ